MFKKGNPGCPCCESCVEGSISISESKWFTSEWISSAAPAGWQCEGGNVDWWFASVVKVTAPNCIRLGLTLLGTGHVIRFVWDVADSGGEPDADNYRYLEWTNADATTTKATFTWGERSAGVDTELHSFDVWLSNTEDNVFILLEWKNGDAHFVISPYSELSYMTIHSWCRDYAPSTISRRYGLRIVDSGIEGLYVTSAWTDCDAEPFGCHLCYADEAYHRLIDAPISWGPTAFEVVLTDCTSYLGLGDASGTWDVTGSSGIFVHDLFDGAWADTCIFRKIDGDQVVDVYFYYDSDPLIEPDILGLCVNYWEQSTGDFPSYGFYEWVYPGQPENNRKLGAGCECDGTEVWNNGHPTGTVSVTTS